MQIAAGNIWSQWFTQSVDAVCITTNGFVKSNGECVMGRGMAKEATRLIPDIAKKLGGLINKYGNRTMIIGKTGNCNILSFPVKPKSISLTNPSQVVSHMRTQCKFGDVIPGWACVADPIIIENSCIQLVQMADKFKWKNIVLPRIGCGAGELNWNDVKVILEKHFDDRFTIMSFKLEDFK